MYVNNSRDPASAGSSRIPVRSIGKKAKLPPMDSKIVLFHLTCILCTGCNHASVIDPMNYLPPYLLFTMIVTHVHHI